MPLLAMSETCNKISFKCHHIGKNNDNLQIEQQERDGTLQEMWRPKGARGMPLLLESSENLGTLQTGSNKSCTQRQTLLKLQ